ncbi:hypothetical protein [Alkanindiges illinoisensis]|uniref:hypothetical protein n=1 Tax=Alkanindiges illinoisensis TaxID=197183 RepID=UPI00047E1755|nr:hypothetical protein [Alkanindiges illinoisensis]
MKGLFSTLFAGMFLTGAVHAADQNLFGTVEYSHQTIKFDDDIKADFDGGTIGFSTSPRQQYGYWGKFEYSNSSKTDSNYYEGTLGINYNLFNQGNFYLNGLAGIGYTRIESGITSSNLNFISVPLAVEGGYSLTPKLDLYASVGYKWLFDTTGRDGYYGNGKVSTGSSTANNSGKVLCNTGGDNGRGKWVDGSDPSLCANFGGVVSNPGNKVLCNNGTWSNNPDNRTDLSGFCSSNGGVYESKRSSLTSLRARYGNSISLGDAQTPVYKIGLRFSF